MLLNSQFTTFLHIALSLYHGFNCGIAQEFYRSSMFCPRNETWSSIWSRSGKDWILVPRVSLGWTLLPTANINESQLLQEFGLQEFSFFFLVQSCEVMNSQSERFGDAWPLDLDSRDSLWEFEIHAFFFFLFVQYHEV
jgi:hypothetical protein